VASIVVRFPDGTKEFRYPQKMLAVNDVIWHDGQRFRVVSVTSDADEQAIVVVEPKSSDLTDLLRSEEGAVRLEAIDA
jgi:hypothetical protein